jgi:hypothetical protein
MPFQVCTRDEYGQVSILATEPDLTKVVELLRNRVNDDNMENSLTLDEKLKDWSSYLVELPDENGVARKDVIYGGREGLSNNVIYKMGEKGVEKELLGDEKIALFIGFDHPNRTTFIPLYAKDLKNNVIDNLKHQMLEGKVSYFVHLIK